MKSLILTLLYLAKDTVHRWFTRISSPLARALVVFFLSLCALAFLGSVAISTKVARERIIERGANIVVSFLTAPSDSRPLFLPSQSEIDKLLNADSYALTSFGEATLADGHKASLYTCSFARLNQILPLLAPSGGPTLLQDGVKCNLPQGPSEITIPGGQRVPIYVRTLSPTHPLMNIMHGKGVIVQEELLRQMQMPRSVQYILGLTIRDLQTSAPVARAEEFLHTLHRLEGVQAITISALDLLRELDNVLDKQMQFRIAFCLGISCIVGILLTALAGMEYRQNEYIYTLMKSFGIHPFLLVGTFIAENLIIVGASFIGAVSTFMYFQRLIVKQLLKLGNQPLTLDEIMPEIMLISYTLLGCVLLSSIPIFVAAHREIGRVLK